MLVGEQCWHRMLKLCGTCCANEVLVQGLQASFGSFKFSPQMLMDYGAEPNRGFGVQLDWVMVMSIRPKHQQFAGHPRSAHRIGTQGSMGTADGG